MRTVVNSQEVAHLWAHAAQDHARNSSKSVFFDGAVIYSYGTHFPMGIRFDVAKAKRSGSHHDFVFLLNSEGYSVTTSKHQSLVRRATYGEHFSVPLSAGRWGRPALTLEEAAEAVKKRARENLEDACKRIKTAKRYALAREAMGWYRAVLTVATHAGQKRKISRILGSIDKLYAEAMQGHEAYEAKREATRARKEKEYQERQERRAAARLAEAQAAGFATYEEYYTAMWEQRRKEEAERQAKEKQEREEKALAALPAWRNGSNHADMYYLPFTALRIKGEEIETSRHVHFPKEHAIKLFPLWKKLVSHGKEYVRNGHTIHLGHYALDKIDAQGNITAGCHYITRDEVEHIARALGLMPKDSAYVTDQNDDLRCGACKGPIDSAGICLSCDE